MLAVEFYMCVALLSYSMGPCYYSYENEEEWAEEYPLCKDGLQQSPIFLGDITYVTDYTKLQLINFDVNLTNVELMNDGTKVVVTLSPDQVNAPEIGGSYLLRNYTLMYMEFHWGPNATSNNTEHLFFDRKFDMEVQLYFIYDTYGENASKYDDGIVAFSLFFHEDINEYTNPNIELIVQKLPEIQQPNSTTTMKRFPAINKLFFSLFANMHYTYIGSMTHPPCTEGIRWYVSKFGYSIGHQQIDAFRQLLDNDGKPMTSNRRDVQPPNERLVTHSNTI